MPKGEVIVTAVVPHSIDEAFATFTNEIDRWWVRSGKRDTVVRFEGDRLVEASPTGAETLGTVSRSEPPIRIEMDWIGPHSETGDTVVVEFSSEGAGTRVTIRHLRPGIENAGALSAVIGLWWGEILSRFQHR
ncbi:MAG: SRPBCC domain-containing protein [Acidimicrobiia bacterium]